MTKTIVVLLLLAILSHPLPVYSVYESSCSLSVREYKRHQQQQFITIDGIDLGDGIEPPFYAYRTPDVTTFYETKAPPAAQFVQPKHQGKAVKFINLSLNTLQIYWEASPKDHDRNQAILIRTIPPFQAKGTSSFPTHCFVIVRQDTGEVWKRVVINDDPHDNLIPADPFEALTEDQRRLRVKQDLSPEDQAMYWKWYKTIKFNHYYRQATGRTYLSAYRRPPPQHFIWPAVYFQQQHWVVTPETHFRELPPNLEMVSLQKESSIAFPEYRQQEPLNLTLTVLSCAPRALEILNFLSPPEVQHILDIAHASELGESTLGDEKGHEKSRNVRTSRNTWVSRKQSAVVDAIYRRAADLLRINEAWLRPRGSEEDIVDPYDNNKSIAEDLQLVHYTAGAEYQAHHDFAYPPLKDELHSARFATLLLYLNDGMEGGETSFPKFLNAHTFLDLRVKPEVGKAVLFYSQLPDGNMDEFSQHEARKVRTGEKWLTNLWVWDPVRNTAVWT
jgi:prolyl 4-hydroxylase